MITIKQAVYFYKDGNDNIPILVSDYNDVKLALFLHEEELKKITKDYPKTIDNLFVLIDGIVFKLTS